MNDDTGKEKRKSVVFYADWYALIRDLDEGQKLEVYNAIFEYAFEDKEPRKKVVKAITALMISAIKRDREKWERIKERRSYGGKKGMQSRWGTKSSEDKEDDKKVITQITQDNSDNSDNSVRRVITPITPITVNVNGNGNVNGLPKGNISCTSNKLEVCGGAELPHPPTASKPIDFEEIRAYWNETTKGAFGELRTLSEARRASIRARIRETSKEDFLQMIDKAAASEFMHGQNSSGWQANFDWCIKPTNYAKVLDGNYDNPKRTKVLGETHDSSAGEKDYFNGDFGI